MHKITMKIFLVLKNFIKIMVLFGMETLCLLFAIIRCFFKVKRFLEISSFPHEEFHFFPRSSRGIENRGKYDMYAVTILLS